jgi:hypothetical protein
MTAEAALLKIILRRRLMAAIVKDDRAWQATYDQLRDAYTRAFDERSQAALVAALERIRSLPAHDFGPADETAILAALEKEMGAEAMQAALRGPVLNLSEALFRIGAEEIGAAAGVDIAFGRPDLDTLDIVGRANLYWVGNSWNAYVDGLFRDALQDYFRDGMTRVQLTERFARDFAGLSERGIVYYEMLADHTATRTREMGRVTGYERAAVEYVQVRAHLDERTTAFCRHMHGRVIAVTRLAEQRAEYLSAVERRDTEAAKAAWVMHGEGDDFSRLPTGQLPRGTAGPPYHFRCRTITVIWTEPQDDPARWLRATLDREPLSRVATEALIEHCKAAAWGSQKALKDHATKHGAAFGGMADYNQAALDRIGRGNRDVYLVVDQGALKALFVEPYTSAKGKPRYAVTIVVVQPNRLVTQHIRPTLDNARYDVPPIKLPGRGIMKWLFNW